METEKTLLQRAKEAATEPRMAPDATEDEIELALAFAYRMINFTQVRKALGTKNPQVAYVLLARALSHYVRTMDDRQVIFSPEAVA